MQDCFRELPAAFEPVLGAQGSFGSARLCIARLAQDDIGGNYVGRAVILFPSICSCAQGIAGSWVKATSHLPGIASA